MSISKKVTLDSQNRLIITLFKFGKRKYMRRFREKGIMYMNTLESHRKHERAEQDSVEGPRFDRLEGLGGLYQSDKVQLTIGTSPTPFTITSANGLRGQVEIYLNKRLKSNVFCMYSIAARDGLFEEPYVNEKNFDFGDSVVAITNVTKFLERVDAAVEKILEPGMKYSRGFVEYYDPKKHEGAVHPFMKDIRFSYQDEYRFVVSPRADGSKPELEIEIGSIEDISVLDDLQKINSLISIKKK